MNTVLRPLKSEPLGRHVGAIHELPAWYAEFLVHRKIFDICKIIVCAQRFYLCEQRTGDK